MIEAATRLVHEGASPSVTEVADAAGVSRATAYRYFPTQESLLAEVIVPDLEAAWPPRRCPTISRIVRSCFHPLWSSYIENEVALRTMLQARPGASAGRVGRAVKQRKRAAYVRAGGCAG